MVSASVFDDKAVEEKIQVALNIWCLQSKQGFGDPVLEY